MSDEAVDGRRLSKPQRHHRLRELLETHPVGSQQQLADLLAADGIAVNQATVSRDLEEMGAIKVRVPGGALVYAVPELPHDQHLGTDHLRRVLSEWVVFASWSEPIVVLKTPPGCAHVVASALDRTGLGNVLGVVAGDDTLFVLARGSVGARGLALELAELAGIDATEPD